jgi:hypothetical protein
MLSGCHDPVLRVVPTLRNAHDREYTIVAPDSAPHASGMTGAGVTLAAGAALADAFFSGSSG